MYVLVAGLTAIKPVLFKSSSVPYVAFQKVRGGGQKII